MSQLLEIVKECDLFAYNGQGPSNSQSLYYLKTHDNQATLGHIVPEVATQLLQYPEFVTLQKTNELIINPELSTVEQRSAKVAEIASKLRASGKFITLKGWRNELYTAYYPTHTPYFHTERAFSPLLGIVMYGVHINGYIPPASSEEELRLWIPRRANNKATFPSMLDNTIAGGLGGGLGPYETAVKEGYEEAGMQEEYIKQNLRQAGVVSYIYVCEEEGGLIQPEVQYVYDLQFKEGMSPQPIDGEVQEFYLMGLAEVMERLRDREFKPNCALVIIDFLIRHGYVTAENEPEYLEIVSRLHRMLGFPTR